MFTRTNLLILLIAMGGAVGGYLASSWLRTPHATLAAAGTSTVGAIAPAIHLPDTNGRAQTLDAWRGKLVLINFWASWCEPCREEMPLLDRTQQRFAHQGLQVVGIADDNLAATKTFLSGSPVRYPILIDDPEHSRAVSLAYGNKRGLLPYSVLIGRDGRIVAERFGIFSGDALDTWLAPFL